MMKNMWPKSDENPGFRGALGLEETLGPWAKDIVFPSGGRICPPLDLTSNQSQ